MVFRRLPDGLRLRQVGGVVGEYPALSLAEIATISAQRADYHCSHCTETVPSPELLDWLSA
jgi:hypothetical protein